MSSSQTRFHAFLSHSSHDRTYAELICQSLESHSLNCWMAPRNIQPGVEWGAAIIDGIERSHVMIVIFSNHANDSAQVRREVERAIGKAMPILPVRIENVPPTGALEFALSNTHWLDAFKSPIEPSLAQLIPSLRSLCGIQLTDTNSPPSNRQSATIEKPTVESIKPEIDSRRGAKLKSVLTASVLLLIVVAAYFSWPPTSEEIQPANTPSGFNQEEFQKRENQKFLGRWVAAQESTPDGKVAPRTVAERAFTLTVRPLFVAHRRNPTRTETATIRGQIEYLERGDYNRLLISGMDENGKKQVWAGIYEYDGETWKICFRRSQDSNRTLQAPIRMNTAGEHNTCYVALKRVAE